MKTAMQELIDDLIEQKNYIPALTYGWFMNKAVRLIEKEKQQIKDTWNSAYGGDGYFNAEDYYNETFK